MSGTKFRVKKYEVHTDSSNVDYEIGAEINQDFPIEAPGGATGKLVVNHDLEVEENTVLTGDLTVGAQATPVTVDITGNVTINAEDQVKIVVEESAAPNQEYFTVVSTDASNNESTLLGCYGNVSGQKQVAIPVTTNQFSVQAPISSISGELYLNEVKNFSSSVINLSGECEASNLKADSIEPISTTGGFSINKADSLELFDDRTAQRSISYEVSMDPNGGNITQKAASDLSGGSTDFLIFNTVTQKIETGATAKLNITTGAQASEHEISYLSGLSWACSQLTAQNDIYASKYSSAASVTTTIEAPTSQRVDIKSDASIRLESNDVTIYADAANQGPRLHLHTDATNTSLSTSPAIQFSESTSANSDLATQGTYGFDIIYNGDANNLDVTSYNNATQYLHLRLDRDPTTSNTSTTTYQSDRPNTASSITGNIAYLHSMLQLNPDLVGQKQWPSGAGSNDFITPLLMDENGFIYGGDLEYSTNNYLQNFSGAHAYVSESPIPVGSSVILLPTNQVVITSTKESKICCGIVAACLEANSHSKRDMKLSTGGTESSLPNSTYICIVLAVGDSRENDCQGFNVCNENGDIQPGDLLVTSSTPGYLMKQDADIIRSCTVGKAMETVVFNDQGQATGVYGYLYCG